MVAFDEAWWDARSMPDGFIDTTGLPAEGSNTAAWTRWRLIDELLRRYYVDFGLEPGFGLMGIELYQVALFSPTCRRAPRYFGRLCGTGIHPEDDTEICHPGVALTWTAHGTDSVHDGDWSTWSDYRHDAIDILGLASAGVTGHEQCFHRRGRALTPLMYRVALLLRTDSGSAIVPSDNAMLTIPGHVDDNSGLDTSPIEDTIRRAGGDVPTGPPRYLGVRLPNDQWIALRTDGWVATPAGTIDAADLWRQGADEQEIALAIQDQIQA